MLSAFVAINYKSCSHWALKSLSANTLYISLLLLLNFFSVTDILPDALKTGCKKCTDVQKRQSKKVINFLIKNKVDHFKELEAQFDPDHEYRKKYGDELKAEGIVLPD